ncbi:restriction endonuclease subunit S [Aminipila butyrica]|uniref:Restriction endonuclease subunit S n=1 Tax=Aminipila butyrica TaxID=433296 RepID=A0A858BU55_9FIRM|nr:restriction endonuclease subunit S [Aminipila butyrica]QIB68719.1 restriction endonuclease subunit S [Aminipila butyrica]
MSDKKENVPKIRFPGFTQEWERRKLGEVGDTFSGLSGKTKEEFGHGDAKFVTYVNVFGNTISDSNGLESIGVDNKQKQVEYGDVFFTISSETPKEVGMSSVWLENTRDVYLNSFCLGYRPTVEFDPYYLAFMLRSPAIREKFIFLAQGISRYNISKKKVMEIKVPVPELSEQNKIGIFFKDIDSLIALQQRKLNNVQKLKAGLLQKMFPKEDEDFPEVRFPGFTDAWKNQKLGDVYEKIRNAFVGTATPYYVKEGHFYLESNNIKDGRINRDSEVFVNNDFYERQRDNWLHTNDLVMVQSGHVGHAAVIPENLDNTAAHALIIIANPREKNNPHFTNYQFQTKKAKRNIDSITTGNTIKHILASEMKKFEIFICGYEEQSQIGNLFNTIDQLITLHQRKLEHLQEQKKALLQQMFV